MGRFHCGLWVQTPTILCGLGRHSHSHRSGKITQRLAARKEAQPHSHDQSRVQDFAQTWGWKMITVHEKVYP